MKALKLIQKLCYLASMILIINLIPINTKAEVIKSDNIDIIILFKDDCIDENVKSFIINSGGNIVQDLSEIGGLEVKCKTDLIPNIQTYSTIQSIAPNHDIDVFTEKTVKLSQQGNSDGESDADIYNMYQWDIKEVTDNGKSFQLESGNHDIVVGIIDSGVDVNHPDLVSNLLGGENLVPADFKGDNTETGDPNDIIDRLGHGTIVAGNIAANGRTKGVAPDIGFKSYRIFNKDGKTNASIASSAIIKAVDDGASVINLSFGGYDLKGKCYWTDSKTGVKYKMGDDMAEYSLYKRAIKYAIKKGVTVVTAAGNDSLNCDDKKQLTNYLNTTNQADGFSYFGMTYENPGSIEGVINVSATGKDDYIASYSNYGAKFIDVTAPGGDYAENEKISDLCLTTGMGGYTYTQGTSVAAPKVSATAALILCKDKTLKPKEVAKRIYKTCKKLEGENSDKYYGKGMVNVFNALSN
ncbi:MULTISPECIES: S8 family peptidase [Clostridium]|nr:MULTISPECIES: S8 family serine peptidase [Clostridium]AVK48515.1 peptidase S8 [Clostridium sp. MF28]NRT79071.1 subtilisin family serine protease [Clostridium beijerinckii]OOM50273.1 thermophilic serine proteinase precursor [Clostridium beijerinckii]PSM58881.1 peptidase S8 [Clostridium diolis]